MFFKLRNDTFVRVYDDVGYIINKSTFSDHATDKSGAVFLTALAREPKSLDEMARIIAEAFVDADFEEIKRDALEFFTVLEQEGFVVSGATEAEIQSKDIGFSYSRMLGGSAYKNLSLAAPDNDTQTFLGEHFKERPRLLSLHIELTSRCNERCIHCYIPHENKTIDIEPSLFYDVLDQCRDMGVLDLTFSGGEALMHPHFCDFLRKAKEYDFSVGVLSNLTLLNDEMLSVLTQGVLSNVNVSLYSMTPEVHDSITKLPGSFEKTKSNILKLIDHDVPVQISCPVMKQNKDSVTDVLEWGHEHKCRVINDYMIMARYDHTTDNLQHRLSVEEAGKVIEDIMAHDVIYQGKILAPDFESISVDNKDVSEDTVCGVCNTYLCLVANGNVYPCSGWQGYIVGNVKETPLQGIWDNSPKVKYLRGIRMKDFPKCLSCEDRGFCALCMAKNSNEDPNGNIFNINPQFCKINALNRKIVMDWKTKQLGGHNV